MYLDSFSIFAKSWTSEPEENICCHVQQSLSTFPEKIFRIRTSGFGFHIRQKYYIKTLKHSNERKLLNGAVSDTKNQKNVPNRGQCSSSSSQWVTPFNLVTPSRKCQKFPIFSLAKCNTFYTRTISLHSPILFSSFIMGWVTPSEWFDTRDQRIFFPAMCGILKLILSVIRSTWFFFPLLFS